MSGLRRKYGDCQRADGNCAACPLVKYDRDCHDSPITRLEWYRRGKGLTQKELADMAGVNIRLVQKVEGGEYKAENLTARNLLNMADALGVDPRKLL